MAAGCPGRNKEEKEEEKDLEAGYAWILASTCSNFTNQTWSCAWVQAFVKWYLWFLGAATIFLVAIWHEEKLQASVLSSGSQRMKLRMQMRRARIRNCMNWLLVPPLMDRISWCLVYAFIERGQSYPVHLRYVISGNCRDATWRTLGNFPLVWVIFRVSEQINSTAIVRCGTTLICRHSGVLIFLFLYHLFFICPSSLIVFLRSQKWMMKSDDPEWTGLF